MTSATTNFQTLSLSKARAWMLATLFIAGNILLPQLCHLIPNGGHIFLPIYVFTLIASIIYGWQLGLLVAVMSPVINSVLFGMPAPSVLPIIIMKGVLLAAMVQTLKYVFGRICYHSIILAILSYQIIGCIIESFLLSSFDAGFADFTIGIPGILLQIAVSYIIVYKYSK